jgi:transposase-like protein
LILPPEFRRRAVELARLRQQPIRKIAQDLGISKSYLRRWMDQADVDQGVKEGLSTNERRELASCAAATGCWRWSSAPGRNASDITISRMPPVVPGL